MFWASVLWPVDFKNLLQISSNSTSGWRDTRDDRSLQFWIGVIETSTQLAPVSRRLAASHDAPCHITLALLPVLLMLYLSCLLESKNAFTSAPCKKQCSAGRVGYNAVPAQKPVNVAMYAAGGAVAGAVVGAGAMCLSLSLVCFFLLNCSTWFCENLCVLCTRRSEDLEFKLEYIAAIESIQDIYIYTCKKIGGWNGIGIWNILCFGAGLRDLFRPLFVHIIEYRLKLFPICPPWLLAICFQKSPTHVSWRFFISSLASKHRLSTEFFVVFFG